MVVGGEFGRRGGWRWEADGRQQRQLAVEMSLHSTFAASAGRRGEAGRPGRLLNTGALSLVAPPACFARPAQAPLPAALQHQQMVGCAPKSGSWAGRKAHQKNAPTSLSWAGEVMRKLRGVGSPVAARQERVACLAGRSGAGRVGIGRRRAGCHGESGAAAVPRPARGLAQAGRQGDRLQLTGKGLGQCSQRGGCGSQPLDISQQPGNGQPQW